MGQNSLELFCLYVFDCSENVYYFSLFLDHGISLFWASQVLAALYNNPLLQLVHLLPVQRASEKFATDSIWYGLMNLIDISLTFVIEIVFKL